MLSAACPVVPRHQPRITFPTANHWEKPCSLRDRPIPRPPIEASSDLGFPRQLPNRRPTKPGLAQKHNCRARAVAPAWRAWSIRDCCLVYIPRQSNARER